MRADRKETPRGEERRARDAVRGHPGFAGQEYTRRAIETARQLLGATGHGTKEGPGLPVGAGVHMGTAFVGAVGTREQLVEMTVLGDAVSTAARLAAAAGSGGLLVGE